MNISKSLLSAGVVTAVAAGSIAGVSAVSAQQNSIELAEKIASDHGLEVSAVEASFSEFKDAKHAEREAEKSAHLDSLVADGSLTQEQRDALQAKFDELKTERDALRDQDLTRDEVRAAMEENRDEMKAWAEEQGIDLESIRPEDGEGFGRRGHGNRHGHNSQDDESDDTSVES